MFSRWPSICLSALRFHLITYIFIYKQILFKFCICICTNNVSLGIVNGQIFSYGTCQCTKNGFGLLVPLLFGVS